MKNYILLLLVINGFALTAKAQSASGIEMLKKTVIGGEGGWDYLHADSNNRVLYVSHSTQVEVLNLDTHTKIATIDNTPGIHGIVALPALGVGYTTNGKAKTATLFDLKTYKALKEIPTGDKPDAIVADNYSAQVFIFNNDGGSVTVLEASSGKIIKTVVLGGAPETGVSNENGLIYVNLEDKNEIVVLDAKSLVIKNRWSLAPGEEPTGLALDIKNNRLFSVCKNELMIVMDAITGKVLAKLPIGKKADGVIFDSQLNYAISSNGEGTLSIVQEVSPTEFKVIETIKTAPGAKTITLDSKSHHVFVATAQYGETPAVTAENPKPKPAILPGTFMVMEFGKK